jgi:hypothetical protein
MDNPTMNLIRILILNMNWREYLSILFLLLYGLPVIFITSVGGTWFPAVTPLHITHIQAENENTTRISGTVQQLRNCTWESTSWFLGRQDEASYKLNVTFLKEPQFGENGESYWDAILVGASPESIVNNSYAISLFKCWPWPYHVFTTQSLFYVGNGRDVGQLNSQTN